MTTLLDDPLADQLADGSALAAILDDIEKLAAIEPFSVGDLSVGELSTVELSMGELSTGEASVGDPAGDAGASSYAALAGAEDDLAPSRRLSPRAAAAKRAGRRRLVLLVAVLTGALGFGGLAQAAQRDAAQDATPVAKAPTTSVPALPSTTVAAPATTPATTAPPVTAPPTTAPPTTAPPTTAPPTTASPTTGSPTTAPTTTWRSATTAATASTGRAPYWFLDCVRARESRGDYGAMNASGAHGAYQLMPTTARETALRAGRTDLASTPVVNWSRADQDAMAALLYQWQGPAPWGGGCTYPGP